MKNKAHNYALSHLMRRGGNHDCPPLVSHILSELRHLCHLLENEAGFHKGAKTIQREKDSLFYKRYWENWTST